MSDGYCIFSCISAQIIVLILDEQLQSSKMKFIKIWDIKQFFFLIEIYFFIYRTQGADFPSPVCDGFDHGLENILDRS